MEGRGVKRVKKVLGLLIIMTLTISCLPLKVLAISNFELPSSRLSAKLPSSRLGAKLPSSRLDAKLPSSKFDMKLPSNGLSAKLPSSRLGLQLPSSKLGLQLPSGKFNRLGFSWGAPKAPADVEAKEESSGSVLVTWEASNGAKGYYVYYKSGNNEFKKVETAFTSYRIAGLANKSKYEIYVRAYNSKGTSAASESVKKNDSDRKAPSKPKNLKAMVIKEGSFIYTYLSWEPSTDNMGIEGYKIYRFNSNKDTSKAEKKWIVKAANFKGQNYLMTTDKDIKKNSEYYYAIEAYDEAGNYSGFSNIVEISTKGY